MDTCKGKYCPRVGKKCIENKCAFYQHILGTHPQTGVAVDLWDCADRVHNILLMQLGKHMNEMGAATEGMRNEVRAGAGSILLKALGVSAPDNQLPEERHARLDHKG